MFRVTTIGQATFSMHEKRVIFRFAVNVGGHDRGQYSAFQELPALASPAVNLDGLKRDYLSIMKLPEQHAEQSPVLHWDFLSRYILLHDPGLIMLSVAT